MHAQHAQAPRLSQRPTSASIQGGEPLRRRARDGSVLSRHHGSPWRECLSYLNWKKKKANRRMGRRGPDHSPATGEPLLSSVSVGTPNALCGCAPGLSHRPLTVCVPRLWGLGSGGIRAMYLCGPSVLACWAGKAVLILILHPLYFWGPSGMSTHCWLHYAQVVCCVRALVAENGNGSYSCAVRFPGGPLGGRRNSFLHPVGTYSRGGYYELPHQYY